MMARKRSWLRADDASAPVLPPDLVARVRADLLANIHEAKRPVLLDEDIQRAWRTIYWAAIDDFVGGPPESSGVDMKRAPIVQRQPAPSSFLVGAIMKWGRLPWAK